MQGDEVSKDPTRDVGQDAIAAMGQWVADQS
jgi:hypothetical protein